MFSVGLPIALKDSKTGEYVWARVIGWDENSCLISNLPFVNQKPIKLKGKDICSARFIQSGTAYGFQVEVISIQFFPIPLIFFKYPDNVSSAPIRENDRIHVKMPSSIYGENIIITDALIVDISKSGCRLRIPKVAEKSIEKEKTYSLSFFILETRLDNCEGVVRNLHSKDEYIFAGIQFQNLPAEKEKKIELYINLLKDSLTPV
jgi:c-di-GMP-binding flagellar brake protein YcgR